LINIVAMIIYGTIAPQAIFFSIHIVYTARNGVLASSVAHAHVVTSESVAKL